MQREDPSDVLACTLQLCLLEHPTAAALDKQQELVPSPKSTCCGHTQIKHVFYSLPAKIWCGGTYRASSEPWKCCWCPHVVSHIPCATQRP